MPSECDYWLIDKDGNDAQCCGPRALAERQRVFFDSCFPECEPFTIVSRPKRDVPEMPKRGRGRRR